MITYQTILEQTAQLERLAPIRERAFKNLTSMRKKRIDSRTEILVIKKKK